MGVLLSELVGLGGFLLVCLSLCVCFSLFVCLCMCVTLSESVT